MDIGSDVMGSRWQRFLRWTGFGEAVCPASPSALLSHFDVCGLVLEVADPPAVAEFTTALRSKHFSQLDLQTFGLAGKGLQPPVVIFKTQEPAIISQVNDPSNP